jgi:hypothetical protein
MSDRAATDKNASIGHWDNFAGSFENTFKTQFNGAIQVANHFGADIKETQMAPVTQNPDFGTAAWAEQLAGQAAAMGVEFFAASKLGALAKVLKAGERPATALELAQPASNKMTSMMTFGAINGGLLTPSNDSDNLVRDRFLQAFGGAGSMLLMSGISSGLEAGAARVGSQSISSIMRNGYFNNAVGGFLGGSANEMATSAVHGNLPNLSLDYWGHVARSGAEFALAGTGTHLLNSAASAFSPSEIAAARVADRPSDLRSVMSAAAAGVQDLVEQTGRMFGIQQPALAMVAAGGRRFSAPSAQMSPLDGQRQPMLSLMESDNLKPTQVAQSEVAQSSAPTAATHANDTTRAVNEAPVNADKPQPFFPNLEKRGVSVGELIDWQKCPHLVWLKHTYAPPATITPYKETVGRVTHYLADKGTEHITDPAVREKINALPQEQRLPALKESYQLAVNARKAHQNQDAEREVKMSWISPETGIKLWAKPDVTGKKTAGNRETKVVADDKSRDHYRKGDLDQVDNFAFVYAKYTGWTGAIETQIVYTANGARISRPFDLSTMPAREQRITADLSAMNTAFTSRLESYFPSKLSPDCRNCPRRTQCDDFMALPVRVRMGNGPLIPKKKESAA